MGRPLLRPFNTCNQMPCLNFLETTSLFTLDIQTVLYDEFPSLSVRVLILSNITDLGCRFDIMDNESYFYLCVLTYAIIYVLIHQIIFRFYLLKYSLFFQVLLLFDKNLILGCL